jgi:NAD(P)-dependent dehydrogenase (short-subunit alcohol dehydrogenase family)
VILRDGLLQGVRAAICGAPAVAERFRSLGAEVTLLEVDPHGQEPSSAPGPADVLVYEGAPEPRAALDGAWIAISSAAIGHMTGEGAAGGQILLLAPLPDDARAEAARAGLENLARTLSIEWSRFGVRPVAILPGPRTTPQEAADLAAFLASPAGAYYSGCVFRMA